MLGQKTPPTAIAVSSGYVLTNLAGEVSAAVGATAFASFDLDNTIVDGYSLGLGIKYYEWQYRFLPYGCLTSPAPPAGASEHTFTMYPSGTIVSPLCHGSYLLEVKVTDDDVPDRAVEGGPNNCAHLGEQEEHSGGDGGWSGQFHDRSFP